MDALRLVQCHLLAGIHALHSLRQQGLVSGITRLRTVLQVSRSEKALLVCHPVYACLDFRNAHCSQPKRQASFRKPFDQRLKEAVKSSFTTSTTFFSIFEPAINSLSFCSYAALSIGSSTVSLISDE